MSWQQLRTRLSKLEKCLPAPPTPEIPRDDKQYHKVVRRLIRLTNQALQLCTEEEAKNVLLALDQWSETGDGPYAWWFRELFRGNCRLPKLAPATMQQLLLTWLSPHCDVFMPVCRNCGLLYPHRRSSMNELKLLPGKVPFVGPPPWYDSPKFFSSCPGCEASDSDFDWSHLMRDINRPWMALDGFVGQPIPAGLAANG